eukprot:CCRYP_011300-RH/>CCRYP_011300-RH protein AED:0.43 eAED:0.43 QI:0/-1/0/1/-1/0/1/0/46
MYTRHCGLPPLLRQSHGQQTASGSQHNQLATNSCDPEHSRSSPPTP